MKSPRSQVGLIKVSTIRHTSSQDLVILANAGTALRVYGTSKCIMIFERTHEVYHKQEQHQLLNTESKSEYEPHAHNVYNNSFCILKTLLFHCLRFILRYCHLT